jgi:hypothetical protein
MSNAQPSYTMLNYESRLAMRFKRCVLAEPPMRSSGTAPLSRPDSPHVYYTSMRAQAWDTRST